LNLSLDGSPAVLAHRTRSTTAYRRRIPEALRIGSITTRVGDDKKSEEDLSGAWEMIKLMTQLCLSSSEIVFVT